MKTLIRRGFNEMSQNQTNMIVVNLAGGLGNWMFQIAFLEYLKALTGRSVILHIVGKSPHSSTDLINTIFTEWRYSITEPQIINLFQEHNLNKYDWKSIVFQFENLYISGYFQHHTYITQTFLNKITLPIQSLERHPGIDKTVFLHIRGGDYVNHQLHDVNLDDYYLRALNEFPSHTKFSIFTNDIEYARTKTFLKNISYEFIQESEIDSLYLMTVCEGGICANSTFSWWGAFLNRNRKLILPSKWFNDSMLVTSGYFFQEASVIQV